MSHRYTESELARIEASADAGTVPHLVAAIREQQHAIDSLRLGLDVATRDREELRAALLDAQEALESLREDMGRAESLRRFAQERGLLEEWAEAERRER